MRRATRVFGGLAVLVLLASAEEASATGRGWLEKLSGPGPFRGLESPTLPIWCFSPKDDEGRSTVDFKAGGLLCSGYQNVPDRTVLISLTFSDLSSQKNALEYDPADTRDKAVNLESWAFSVDLKLHPGLDLGVGVGFNKFSGRVFDSFTRFSLEPFRVVFRPVGLLFPKKATWPENTALKVSLRDLIQVKFRSVLFPEGFRAADFGSSGDFEEPSELLVGYSVTLGVVVWW